MGSIFESFSREESRVRKIEGTGLGLAISKRLIDMMGGTITVESKEGEGSRFCLMVDFPKGNDIAAVDDDTALHLPTENIHILMAEDNDFNFEIAQAVLENHGFTVQRAENGQEAVKRYCQAPTAFDFILMDLRRPVVDGYQAAAQIRAFEADSSELPHIPIFALSADVFEEDIRKCMAVGMDGHISKPINMNELLFKIKRHLNP